MRTIADMLAALDERTIAHEVAVPHDEARMQFPLRRNTVDSFDEFSSIIGEYYTHHFTMCVASGGSLSRMEAQGRAKELLEREYRRRNGDIVMAFNDAHDGTNGGLRAVLDMICDGLKTESVERYVRGVFDAFVSPNAWEKKLEIIRQFIARCGLDLSSSIRADQPERYAHEYRDLIRSYVDGLQRTSSVFRRL